MSISVGHAGCRPVPRGPNSRNQTFRRAWLDGTTERELTDLVTELKHGLPGLAPPVPATMFIHSDILITSGQNALPAQLVRALWVLNSDDTGATASLRRDAAISPGPSSTPMT